MGHPSGRGPLKTPARKKLALGEQIGYIENAAGVRLLLEREFMSSKKTTGQNTPKSYRELLVAFRALSKECEIAKRLANDNLQSGLRWKTEAEKAKASGKCDQERAVYEIQEREKAEAARDLAIQGKAGADLREAAAMEEVKALKNTELALLADVQYLNRRITWSDNKVHELERQLLELGYRAGLSTSELRAWNKSVHLDSRGVVA